jgi:hypothetical protein
LNLYEFCGNNPVNYVDPDGQLAWLVSGAVGGGIDLALQIVTGMVDGQSFTETVSDVNWGSVAVSAVASGVGYGLLSAADKAMDAYKLVKVGKSTAQLTYNVSKNGTITTGLATQIVKSQMLQQGNAQLAKTVAITATVQATKKIVKDGGVKK